MLFIILMLLALAGIAIQRILYFRSQCFHLGSAVDELAAELTKTNNALKEETAMRNKYFRKYCKLNAQLNIPVKGDIIRSNENQIDMFTAELPTWVTQLENLTDNGMDVISALENIKQIPEDFVWVKSAPLSPEEYQENFCAAFHASDADCSCDAI
jgi:hypothetical protein